MNHLSLAEGLRQNFSSVGQEHVFKFWKELNNEERAVFIRQLQTVDLDELTCSWRDIQNGTKQPLSGLQKPQSVLPLNPRENLTKFYKDLGEDILSQNKVAAFTVAGGQGTRLGHKGPKGTFKCTPIRGISLFEQFAENLKFITKRFGHSPQWFIMTSEENHLETESFLSQNKYFGLNVNHIHLLRQGMMPVFDQEGKILLSEKNYLLMSPNGHGGSFRALFNSGALKIMEEEGIDHLSYFQVDNPLVHCLDPVFLGYHKHQNSEMSSKVVQKSGSNEKVGTFFEVNKKLHVLEYSDIPLEVSAQKTHDGELFHNLGNIAIHLIERDFIKRIATAKNTHENRLSYHGALKKANHLDNSGNKLTPHQANAIKAETFVFDAIPLAQNASLMEVDRNEEFAPIKNADGQDSPFSSREMQLLRSSKWLSQVGIDQPPRKMEISPEFAPSLTYFKEEISKLSLNPELIKNEKIIFEKSGPKIVKT